MMEPNRHLLPLIACYFEPNVQMKIVRYLPSPPPSPPLSSPPPLTDSEKEAKAGPGLTTVTPELRNLFFENIPRKDSSTLARLARSCRMLHNDVQPYLAVARLIKRVQAMRELAELFWGTIQPDDSEALARLARSFRLMHNDRVPDLVVSRLIKRKQANKRMEKKTLRIWRRHFYTILKECNRSIPCRKHESRTRVLRALIPFIRHLRADRQMVAIRRIHDEANRLEGDDKNAVRANRNAIFDALIVEMSQVEEALQDHIEDVPLEQTVYVSTLLNNLVRQASGLSGRVLPAALEMLIDLIPVLQPEYQYALHEKLCRGLEGEFELDRMERAYLLKELANIILYIADDVSDGDGPEKILAFRRVLELYESQAHPLSDTQAAIVLTALAPAIGVLEPSSAVEEDIDQVRAVKRFCIEAEKMNDDAAFSKVMIALADRLDDWCEMNLSEEAFDIMNRVLDDAERLMSADRMRLISAWAPRLYEIPEEEQPLAYTRIWSMYEKESATTLTSSEKGEFFTALLRGTELMEAASLDILDAGWELEYEDLCRVAMQFVITISVWEDNKRESALYGLLSKIRNHPEVVELFQGVTYEVANFWDERDAKVNALKTICTQYCSLGEDVHIPDYVFGSPAIWDKGEVRMDLFCHLVQEAVKSANPEIKRSILYTSAREIDLLGEYSIDAYEVMTTALDEVQDHELRVGVLVRLNIVLKGIEPEQAKANSMNLICKAVEKLNVPGKCLFISKSSRSMVENVSEETRENLLEWISAQIKQMDATGELSDDRLRELVAHLKWAINIAANHEKLATSLTCRYAEPLLQRLQEPPALPRVQKLPEDE